MNNSIYTTTSIPYVNSKPHVGHAQEFIVADCIARSYRAQGYKVVFQTGTDENAFKNVVAAQTAGIPPQQFVDHNSEIFRSLVQDLSISIDTFIRTTERRHVLGVRKFWSLLKSDDLYEKSYEGLYCLGCEDFFLEKDLVGGLCPDHKTIPEIVAEQNLFFRLSKYQKDLDALIASDRIKIFPESRKNETLSFIRQGLQDISLTRASSRTGGWGIPVPGKSEQVIYVWIDALINYLTGQGFGESSAWSDVWNTENKKIHVIGKNVWKFHAIYWPALLLSAGLPVPNEIVVHGFLTNNGVKISKSLGNAIDPSDVVKEFGSNAVRHFLLGCTPIFSDSDFSSARLRKAYVDDLAHRFGNLYSRLLTLCEKAGFRLQNSTPQLEDLQSDELVTNYSIQEASRVCWREIDLLNAEINQLRPWELLKKNDLTEVNNLLKGWCARLHRAARGLRPFIPEAAGRVLDGLEGRGAGRRILFPLKG